MHRLRFGQSESEMRMYCLRFGQSESEIRMHRSRFGQSQDQTYATKTKSSSCWTTYPSREGKATKNTILQGGAYVTPLGLSTAVFTMKSRHKGFCQ